MTTVYDRDGVQRFPPPAPKERPEDVKADLKRRGFPGWRHMTAAERRNEKMHRMFEFARRTQGDDYGK